MNKRCTIGFYWFAIVLFVMFAFCPLSWDTPDLDAGPNDYGIGTISVLRPLISTTLLWASVCVAFALLFLALLAYRWPVIRSPPIAILLAIVGLPLAGFTHAVRNLGPWTLHGTVTDADGSEYVFCDTSFLQGQVMAIGRIKNISLLGTRIEVLVSTRGDSPSTWASIVRPAPPRDIYGQLYLTNDRKLVGVRRDNHCYLVYDLAKDRFYGYDEVETISPFICLDSDDDLYEPDVDAIRKTILTSEPGWNGYPRRETLEAGLEHPNPAVREVAAESLIIMDEASAD